MLDWPDESLLHLRRRLVDPVSFNGEFRIKSRLAKRIWLSDGNLQVFVKYDDGVVLSGLTIVRPAASDAYRTMMSGFHEITPLRHRDNEDQGVIFRFRIYAAFNQPIAMVSKNQASTPPAS